MQFIFIKNIKIDFSCFVPHTLLCSLIYFLQGEQFAYHEDWGEALVSKSHPVLCVLDIEGDNVSVLEGVPDSISPGQVGTALAIILRFALMFVHLLCVDTPFVFN